MALVNGSVVDHLTFSFLRFDDASIDALLDELPSLVQVKKVAFLDTPDGSSRDGIKDTVAVRLPKTLS